MAVRLPNAGPIHEGAGTTPAFTIPFAIQRRLGKHPPQFMHDCLKHSRTHLAGAVLLLSLTSVALAAAGDWPQFRGPNRDGASAETGLLQDLLPGGPPLVWKANGLGIGYSTVSVVGKRIYTLGEDTNSSSVVALNSADGKKVWSGFRKTLGSQIRNDRKSWTHSRNLISSG